MNGSFVKNGWHHSVSGAVGAMCRHRSVDSANPNRVAGGLGTYLNMSSRGWPEVARIVRAHESDFLAGDGVDGGMFSCSCGFQGERRMYVGFVSQVKEENAAAGPNIMRGRGCCGKMVPEGSDAPGRRCIGNVRARSWRWPERLIVG